MKTFFARVFAGISGLLLCLALSATAQTPGYDLAIGPDIRIVSPANHQVFHTPVNIPIIAFVTRGTDVKKVEFYANGNDLGSGINLSVSGSPPGSIKPLFVGAPTPRLGAVYLFYWTNVPPNAYTLTAVVTHTNPFVPVEITSRTSAPVNITVFSCTNITTGPRVVSIYAVDPVAIAGTNKWIWSGETNINPAWTSWPPPVIGWFTNWGPKDALFMVRLQGNTSDVFTVNYNIGGTASNGVDYAMLPGSVTFPAGQNYVFIPVVPIDNGPTLIPKTVILTLTPDTNGPPPVYYVGKPDHAEAIILRTWPRPLPFFLADGSYHVGATGPDGAWFAMQNSTDMVNWTSVATNQVIDGTIDFVDPNAPNNPNGYYRTIQLNAPPSQ
jgi:hypothetical protein